MGNNAQKTPAASGQVRYTRAEIEHQMQQTGQRLPVSVVAVSGAFVTVNFEVTGPIAFPRIQVPQAISRYARPPTQIGDRGYVQAADAYLTAVTGVTSGAVPYATQPANLSALVYVPLSNTAWPNVDPNAFNITGPNGAVIKDDSGNSIVTLLPGSITLSSGGTSIVINASGITLTSHGSSVVINASGVSIMGKDFLGHMHTGVRAGTNDTGGVA